MRFSFAAAVLVAVGGAAATDVPPWLVLLASLAGSAGLYRWAMVRVDRRIQNATAGKTEAEEAEIMARLRREALADIEQHMSGLRSQLETAKAEAAQVKAERDATVLRLEKRITSLEDELATTRAQVGLSERRKPAPRKPGT